MATSQEHLDPQKLEDAKKHPPLEPLEGGWPFPHFDFSPPILILDFSKTVREYISVGLGCLRFQELWLGDQA